MLKTSPLTPAFGVEIQNVDLNEATADHLFPALRDAFEEHSALLFRGQELSEESHWRIAGLFGPIDRRDSHVAGVRFRTWWPARCLHPNIPPHGPLVFDLVDTWNGRSLGGCTYHVSHPGGFNYEFQPVNALEADGRRAARFEPFGHTPGPFEVFEPTLSGEAPHTLDLRRQ